MKTNQTIPKNMDEYIAGFPRDVQEILKKIRVTIKETALDPAETIKYQMPTFILRDNLVHFAAGRSISGSIIHRRHTRYSKMSYPVTQDKCLVKVSSTKGSQL